MILKGLVVSDSWPIISLACMNKLDLLVEVFEEILISTAVWSEVTNNIDDPYHSRIFEFFKERVKSISSQNLLQDVMDYGESESVLLYKESKASFLLIDDKRARKIAESLNVNCIGTIGLLAFAKEKGIISEVRPLFIELLKNKRYYSLNLLNEVLTLNGEKTLI